MYKCLDPLHVFTPAYHTIGMAPLCISRGNLELITRSGLWSSSLDNLAKSLIFIFSTIVSNSSVRKQTKIRSKKLSDIYICRWLKLIKLRENFSLSIFQTGLKVLLWFQTFLQNRHIHSSVPMAQKVCYNR